MFPLILALRYMRKPAPITIAVLIAVGVIVYSLLLGITEGLREYWMHQLLGLRSHCTLSVKLLPQGVRNYRPLVAELEKIPGVAVASPFREDTAFAFTAQRRAICQVKALKLEDLVRYGTIRKNVDSDRFETKRLVIDGKEYDRPGCIIGNEFSLALGLKPGDEITLMTDVNPDGKVTPNFMQFYVQEIRHDVADIFDRDVWVDFEAGRKLLGGDSNSQAAAERAGIKGISIFLQDSDPDSPLLEPVRSRALEIFRKHIQDSPAYDIPFDRWTRDDYLERATAETWKEIDRKWYANAVWQSQVSRIGVFLVIFLFALFMLFFMSVLVRDKRRDIGILMATGTTPWQIAQSFLWLAAIVTTFAMAVGLPAGYLAVNNVNGIFDTLAAWGIPIFTKDMLLTREIPVSSHMNGEYLMVAVFSYGVMLMAAILPSIRAARTDPVRTLHYE